MFSIIWVKHVNMFQSTVKHALRGTGTLHTKCQQQKNCSHAAPQQQNHINSMDIQVILGSQTELLQNVGITLAGTKLNTTTAPKHQKGKALSENKATQCLIPSLSSSHPYLSDKIRKTSLPPYKNGPIYIFFKLC